MKHWEFSNYKLPQESFFYIMIWKKKAHHIGHYQLIISGNRYEKHICALLATWPTQIKINYSMSQMFGQSASLALVKNYKIFPKYCKI